MTVVSHDRYFLERVTDHVIALLGDRKLSFLAGGVAEYLDRVGGTLGKISLPTTMPAAACPAPGGGLGLAGERTARKESAAAGTADRALVRPGGAARRADGPACQRLREAHRDQR